MIFIFIYSAYNIKNIRPDMQAKDADNERVSLPGQEKSGQNFSLILPRTFRFLQCNQKQVPEAALRQIESGEKLLSEIVHSDRSLRFTGQLNQVLSETGTEGSEKYHHPAFPLFLFDR